MRTGCLQCLCCALANRVLNIADGLKVTYTAFALPLDQHYKAAWLTVPCKGMHVCCRTDYCWWQRSMICTAQRSTLVFLPFSKHEALRRVLHGLPIPPAIQISSVMLTTAAPIRPGKDHDIQSEQQEVHCLRHALIPHRCATGTGHRELILTFPANIDHCDASGCKSAGVGRSHCSC